MEHPYTATVVHINLADVKWYENPLYPKMANALSNLQKPIANEVM